MVPVLAAIAISVKVVAHPLNCTSLNPSPTLQVIEPGPGVDAAGRRRLVECGRQSRQAIRNAHNQRLRQVMRGKPALPIGGRVAAQDDDGRGREQFAERHAKAAVAAGLAFHRRLEGLERAFGGFAPARLAEQMAQTVECKRGNAVARRRCVVVADLGAMDQAFVIVADKKEAAVIAVFELIEQHLRKIARPRDVAGAQIVLHELDQRIEQKSVIVEIGVQMRAAVLAGCQQTAVAPERCAQKIRRAPCP